MADPASSIITLTTVSLAIIQKTAQFIEEARSIDALVQKLHDSLRDLQAVITIVESTCRQAIPRDDDPSEFIEKTLTRCQDRLDGVETTVRNLAGRQSRSFLHKAVLTIRTRSSRSEVEKAIEDIKGFMGQINTGIGCWTLQVNSAIERRASGAPPVQRAIITPIDQHPILRHDSLNPIRRTLSDADTLFDTDVTLDYRNPPSTTHSRPSISSLSSQPSGLSGYHIENIQEAEPVKSSEDWEDFHYRVAKCGSRQRHIEEIEAILRQDSRNQLVNSMDSTRRTPLHLAAQRGDVELARILLQYSADVNAKDAHSCSVLDLALSHNQEDFVELLIDMNVNGTAISGSRNRKRFEEIQDAVEFRREETKRLARKKGKSHKRTQVTT